MTSIDIINTLVQTAMAPRQLSLENSENLLTEYVLQQKPSAKRVKNPGWGCQSKKARLSIHATHEEWDKELQELMSVLPDNCAFRIGADCCTRTRENFLLDNVLIVLQYRHQRPGD